MSEFVRFLGGTEDERCVVSFERASVDYFMFPIVAALRFPVKDVLQQCGDVMGGNNQWKGSVAGLGGLSGPVGMSSFHPFVEMSKEAARRR